MVSFDGMQVSGLEKCTVWSLSKLTQTPFHFLASLWMYCMHMSSMNVSVVCSSEAYFSDVNISIVFSGFQFRVFNSEMHL